MAGRVVLAGHGRIVAIGEIGVAAGRARMVNRRLMTPSPHFQRPARALLISLILATAACSGGGGSGSVSGPTPTPSSTPSPTGILPYSASIKVAFIGASVTVGATGSSRAWSAQTASWLRSKYRSVEVRDLALSYTTSQFGAYRIDGDLRGYVPDLVFIEFAVNDLLLDENGRTRYTDALIYKLRQVNPRVVIVYVAAANALDAPTRTAGGVPAHITQIKRVADRDQVRFIDAGAALWSRIASGGGSIFTYLPDGIHPNEAGADIYFAAVRDALDAYLPTAAAGPAATHYITQSRLQDARILAASSASASGCAISDQRSANSYWRFQQALTCTGGNSFTLDFTGTSIGFVYGAGKDTGALDCSIDGGASQVITLFDGEPLPSGLFLYADLLTGLPNSSHRLSCRVQSTPPTVNGVASTGTRTVIAGFMVSQEQPVTP